MRPWEYLSHAASIYRDDLAIIFGSAIGCSDMAVVRLKGTK